MKYAAMSPVDAEGAPSASPSTETSSEPTSIEQELATAFDSAETPAADSGKPDTATAQADGSQAPPVSGDQPKPEQAQPLEVPKHWNEADKALFAKAPHEIQERWIARETEQQKGLDEKFRDIASFKKERDELDTIFEPFKRDMELNGVSRVGAINQLIAANKFLNESPLEALRWLAQMHGVDPAALAAADDGTQAPSDPRFDELRQNYTQLNSKVDSYLKTQTDALTKQNTDRVNAFADAKDESGELLNPYFDEVSEEILQLMAGAKALGKEMPVEVAYKKAIRGNDEVSAKIEADKAKKKAAKDDAERIARVAKAKRASVGTDAQGANGSAPPKTVEDELSQALEGWTG